MKAPGKRQKEAWPRTYVFEFKQHFPGELDALFVDILNGCYVSLEKRHQPHQFQPDRCWGIKQRGGESHRGNKILYQFREKERHNVLIKHHSNKWEIMRCGYEQSCLLNWRGAGARMNNSCSVMVWCCVFQKYILFHVFHYQLNSVARLVVF